MPATEALLAQATPDAIICANDLLAVAAIKVLRRRGHIGPRRRRRRRHGRHRPRRARQPVAHERRPRRRPRAPPTAAELLARPPRDGDRDASRRGASPSRPPVTIRESRHDNDRSSFARRRRPRRAEDEPSQGASRAGAAAATPGSSSCRPAADPHLQRLPAGPRHLPRLHRRRGRARTSRRRSPGSRTTASCGTTTCSGTASGSASSGPCSVTMLQFFASLGLALLLNLDLKLRWLARTLALVPWAMPPVIVAIMWRLMLNPTSGSGQQDLRSSASPADQLARRLQVRAPGGRSSSACGRGCRRRRSRCSPACSRCPTSCTRRRRSTAPSTFRRFCHVTLPAPAPDHRGDHDARPDLELQLVRPRLRAHHRRARAARRCCRRCSSTTRRSATATGATPRRWAT